MKEETASKQEHKYSRVYEAGGKCQMEEKREWTEFKRKKIRKPQKYGTTIHRCMCVERTPEANTNDKEGEDDQTKDTK